MICQRCKIAHGAPQRGAYNAYRLAVVQSGMCELCVREIEYEAFLYRRAGVDIASADSYGVSDDYVNTMFADVEGGE